MAKAKIVKKTLANDYTIGVDLGGTKMLTALVDSQGRVVHQTTRPVTPPDRPHLDPRDPYQPTAAEAKKHVEYVVEAMADTVVECAQHLAPKDRRLIRGMGLASAGPMDLSNGLLIDSSNMKGWKRVALVASFAKACGRRDLPATLKRPAGFQNDAVAAALGEGWVGVAKSKSTYVMITVGTGIGTGVILNGRPAQSEGRGSEWGHLICESRGLSKRTDDPDRSSPDGIASGTGLVRQAQLFGYSEFKTARQITEAATRGDVRAKDLLLQSSEALAALFYSLSLGFNPEIFAVTGGMLAMKEFFLPQAIDIYRSAIRTKYPSFEKPIKVSKAGTIAGVIGAARLPRL